MTRQITIQVSIVASLTALASLILYRQLTSSKSKNKRKGRSIDEVQHHDTAINLLEVEVIDLFRTDDEIESGDYLKRCEGVAEALRENGYVIVRDSRVSITDNDAFLDMMERSAYHFNFSPFRCHKHHLHFTKHIDIMPNLMASETLVQNIITKSV